MGLRAYIGAALRNAVVNLGRTFLVLALLVGIGAHWTVMQSVAWTQMIVERSAESSFAEAVRTTFDGDHPCNLCLRIAEETQKEKQPGQGGAKLKLDLVLEVKVPGLYPPERAPFAALRLLAADSRSAAPPIPPPRRA